MISGSVRGALGIALLLLPSVAAADDGGDDASPGDDATTPTTVDSSTFVDGPEIACDGALCEPRNGSTCDVPGVSAGHTLPATGAGVFVAFGAISTVGFARRSRWARRRTTGDRPGPGALARRPSRAAPPRPAASRNWHQ
jgi:hypothetical protein